MKTITIGDIHGVEDWKKVDPYQYDKIIFVGDYVDSFGLKDEDIFANLLDIIAFKEAYPDKVVLLLGNHDIQYLFQYSQYGCSGFRSTMYPSLHAIFNDKKKLFQVSYLIQNEDFDYLWTHAGVHSGWYKQYFYPKFIRRVGMEDRKIDEQIEAAFLDEEYSLFQVGHLRGGYESVGGIFWADKRLTSQKPLARYHQIVGHTHVPEIHTVDIDFYTSITYVDCLQDKHDFYKLEIY